MTLPCLTIPITLTIQEDDSCDEVAFSADLPHQINHSVVICTEEEPPTLHLPDLTPPAMVPEATFRWPDGGTESSRVMDQPGSFRIDVKTPCYTFPIILDVREQRCQTHLYVPNAFSPNDDGRNDHLRPFLETAWTVTDYHFDLYNRWGQRVFSTRSPEEGWDGRHRGRPAPGGVYTWVLRYTLADGKPVEKVESGSILLLR
jgi:gliding motility-associated-like protein